MGTIEGVEVGDAHPNALAARLAAAIVVLGVCLGTRTRARKHGYRPQARRHVERYLLRQLGVRADDMARAEGYSRSNIYRSIQLGEEIIRKNVQSLGVSPDDLFERC